MKVQSILWSGLDYGIEMCLDRIGTLLFGLAGTTATDRFSSISSDLSSEIWDLEDIAMV